MMYGWNTGMGAYGGGLLSILTIIGLIIVIVFLFLWFTNKTGSISAWKSDSQPRQRAEDILETRYARGEITREEFLKIKSDLEDWQNVKK